MDQLSQTFDVSSLVVAYAIAGRVDLDLTNDPLGTDKEGNPIFLKCLISQKFPRY